ncbi:MAG: TlpA disulfide reductase family protein [Candidatus Aminicenantales bacterium]
MIITLAMLVLTAFAGQGASLERPYALMVGDTAPAVQVSRFIKGEPFRDFQKGRVYIVEFWATWCVPCKESYPHLTMLQKKHGEKVRILGVSVWEPRPEAVEPFVKEWGEKMGYSVAMDEVEFLTPPDEEERSRESVEKGQMSKAYMVDSGWDFVGIPAAFIVNQEGRIAWIGDPLELDGPLEEVIAGTYDLAEAAAHYRNRMVREAFARGERKKARELLKAKDPEGALQRVDGLLELDPTAQDDYIFKFEILLLHKLSPDRATRFMMASLPELDWVTTMNMTAILADLGRDLSPEAARAGIEACQDSLQKIGKDHTWPLFTMAELYYRLGETENALAAADRALKICREEDRKRMQADRDRYAKGGGSMKEPKVQR